MGVGLTLAPRLADGFAARVGRGCPSQLFGVRCPACEGSLTNVQGTARTSGDAFDEPGLVFDLIGNRWYGTTIIDAPESCNGKAEREWHWIYLREQPNGTLSGEWIEDSIGCYIKRTATFTRIGDADIASVPNPADLSAHKLSKALYLHGLYHSKTTVTGASTKPPEEADYSVDTICLRDGDRCLSRFLQTDG